MSGTVALLFLALSAAPNDAPLRLISQHGVDIVADEQVFLLFAAMNGAGYAEESARKGPPLLAPVFDPLRIEVREALAKIKEPVSLDAMKKLFEENGGEIEDYLAAALAREDKGLSPSATKIRVKLLPALDRFRDELGVTKIYDGMATNQRDQAKLLKTRVEKSFAEAANMLGTAVRAPADLIVIPNPLDSHGSVRVLYVDKRRVLVVGPGEGASEHAVLLAALRPVLNEAVGKAYPNAKNFQKSWEGLKGVRRIAAYKDGDNYLAEGLAQAVAFRVRLKIANKPKDQDEEFIDEQAKDGLRWARIALKVVDSREAGTTIAEDLNKQLPKLTP